ncbi:MAG: MMPL family transporter [Planctomycetota bacterium]
MVSPNAPRRWPWLLLLPGLAVLLWFQLQVGVDIHNSALKAPGTPDAQRVERLARTFGGESTVAFAFAPLSRTPIAPLERAAVDALADRLGARPGVRSADRPESPADDLELVVLDLEPTADATRLVDAARELTPPTLRVLAAGLPLAEAAIARGVSDDRDRLVPVIAAVLFLLALLLYRDLPQAVATVLPAFVTILLLGAAMYGLDLRLDPVLVLLEPVILTVGVAAAVHFVAVFRRFRADGHAAVAAALRARADLARPATLAAATTMLGFGSLSLHPIPAVADFGVLAAVGTAVAHAVTLVLLPRWLASFPGGPVTLLGGTGLPFRCYTAWLLRRRGVLLVLTSLAAATAIMQWSGQEVDNDPMAVLPASDPFRAEFAEFCTLCGGAETVAVLVDGDSLARTPDRLIPFLAAAASTPPAAGLAGPARLGRDGTVMVPLRLAPSGSAARTALFADIERRAHALGWDGVHTAGLAVQIARDSNLLVRGQMAGLGFALVGIFTGLLIGLRSLRLALIGIVPNALPCVLLYGGLAWTGAPLTAANAMIGSVMLGLVIDNTIHLLHRFRRGRGPASQRVAAAFEHVCRPMLVSSLVLALGFGTGLLGSMQTAHEFATLAALAIGLALVSDAVVLPVLLLTRTGRRAIE